MQKAFRVISINRWYTGTAESIWLSCVRCYAEGMWCHVWSFIFLIKLRMLFFTEPLTQPVISWFLSFFSFEFSSDSKVILPSHDMSKWFRLSFLCGFWSLANFSKILPSWLSNVWPVSFCETLCAHPFQFLLDIFACHASFKLTEQQWL